ncbi:MAG: ABC transporter ATP-binding protein [Phycisphaerales bacterium]|jgi:ABC-2 type transport system ATP-binding protein|nr:ABC transporter ATP-binding protein [Phycisphaerales bacterium]
MGAMNLLDIYKTYRGNVHALRGVSIDVSEGEIYGLLGPNGAGKSTLVKIIMTVIHATKSSGTVLGLPIGHPDGLRQIGYLPEHHQFPRYLTGNQVLHYYAALSGVARSTRTKRARSLLSRLGLAGWGKRKISTYSKGMLQRLGIAQALMNNPKLLVLDEPTDGVDPVGRREIRDLLSELKDEGHAIFLNSHLLSELEMVCDRVAIMVKGQVTMQGTIDSLTKESKRIEIELACAPPEWSHTEFDSVKEKTLTKLGDDILSVQPLIDRLRRDSCVISSIRPVRESLEELFLRAVDYIDNPGSIGDEA